VIYIYDLAMKNPSEEIIRKLESEPCDAKVYEFPHERKFTHDISGCWVADEDELKELVTELKKHTHAFRLLAEDEDQSCYHWKYEWDGEKLVHTYRFPMEYKEEIKP